MSSEAPTRPSTAALATMLGSSAALTGLAVYQWYELLELRAGHTPACAVNETLNCGAVWNSPFAHRVHDLLGLPVAGLGVLWGLVALLLAGLVAMKGLGAAGRPFVGGAKLTAGVGVLSVVTFVAASFAAKAVCLTCLGTYALVAVYGVGALGLLDRPGLPSSAELGAALGWCLVLTVPAFLLLLIPGGRTPKAAEVKVPVVQNPSDPNSVDAIFDSMGPQEKLQTAWARAQWQKGQPKDVSMYPVRHRSGPADAKVKVVEFTDILCGHCAQFNALMGEIERLAPPGSLSVEPRYYPLDAECNPTMKNTAGDGVRCFGAKLQLCLESNPRFHELRNELFANQQRLDQQLMLSIATKYGAQPMVLQACIASADTQARLNQDIEYATRHGIQGTPLVLLNGREAPPAPAFLLGMVLSGGNADAPFFQKLPPPPAE